MLARPSMFIVVQMNASVYPPKIWKKQRRTPIKIAMNMYLQSLNVTKGH